MFLRGDLTAFTSAPRDVRRILVIQLQRIGDALLGTPALRALAAHFPQAEIDFMAEPPSHEALLGHPLLHRLVVAPRLGQGDSWLTFIRKVRARKYDWVIDFYSNPRSAQYTFLSGANVRVGLNRRGRRWAYTHRVVEDASDRDRYAADLRLEILRHLGVSAAGRELEIYADQAEPAEAARAAGLLHTLSSDAPIVAVATGGANIAKRYPAAGTAHIIAALRQNHRTVILTSGPGESPLAAEIQALLTTPVPHLADARVPTLAALYRYCQLYVGPDSAPKHIASACGLPTVTLFGPGNPANWNDPQNLRNIVFVAPCDTRPNCAESDCTRKGCIGKIAADDVTAAAERLLALPAIKK